VRTARRQLMMETAASDRDGAPGAPAIELMR
jgi:hypothetical protein